MIGPTNWKDVLRHVRQQTEISIMADTFRWPHWKGQTMSEQTDIPQWALDRVYELTGFGSSWKAFARYIAQHEQPPVDPLLLEAREIAAEVYERQSLPEFAGRLRDGFNDDDEATLSALAGLRRGIEIGREG